MKVGVIVQEGVEERGRSVHELLLWSLSSNFLTLLALNVALEILG